MERQESRANELGGHSDDDDVIQRHYTLGKKYNNNNNICDSCRRSVGRSAARIRSFFRTSSHFQHSAEPPADRRTRRAARTQSARFQTRPDHPSPPVPNARYSRRRETLFVFVSGATHSRARPGRRPGRRRRVQSVKSR